MSGELPSAVIVGRPNVGKSTLFNRLTESRRSIVTDEPGITRDRIYGTVQWNGRPFELVDTGGLLPDDKAAIPREIFRQARVAMENAAVLVLVVDARAGVHPLDRELAQILRRVGKPIIIAVNKVDTGGQTSLAGEFFELGGRVVGVSAEHGRGVDDLLDEITRDFPRAEVKEKPRAVRVAIIGRPNVGKSTLLNRLAGEERSIVAAEPGTTRDAVDTLVEQDGSLFQFIDTAGIRRKAKTKLVAEKLSVVMARKHLEQADVALLVLDGAEGVTSQDASIAEYGARSGCSIILALNKWDLAQKLAAEKMDKKISSSELRKQYEEMIRGKLKFLAFAPLVFISALSGQHTGRLFDLIRQASEARKRRISTGELNRWLKATDLQRGSSPGGAGVRILYLTQASVEPPTFVLFTNRVKPLHFSYQRYLENRLRETFDFTGTPIRFTQREKKRRA
ncbi:MAG TPA: ribosome biogenesis GTPase Der [Candidatus Acidoferrales bacterium]|nr:ribosome biogenesis GTPase Der [Candidatus Acidoferrales bacterium]